MSNKERGEVELSLAGETFTARPTHEAMARIETRTGLGIIAIAMHSQMQFSSAEITTILYECVKAFEGVKHDHEMPWSRTDFQALVFKEGLIAFSSLCTQLVSTMITGETENEIEEKKTDSTHIQKSEAI